MKKAITIIVIFLILVSIGVLALYKMMAKETNLEMGKVENGSFLILDLSRQYPERTDFEFTFFTDFNKNPLAFYRMIQAVDYAIDDDKIEALVIIGAINRLNRAQAEELYTVLNRFGEKKKIYGYAEYLTMGNAVLLSQCDSLFMPDVGNIIMPGLSIQPMFYKGLFDKIGIGFDVVQHGKYKGGMENFIREDFSEPFEMSLNELIDDIYDFYKVRITEGRGLPEYQFDSLLDKAIIYGDDVLESGLVDGNLYRNQLDSLLESRIKEEVIGDDIEADDYKIGIKKYANTIRDKMSFSDEKIALVIAEGNIMSGSAKKSPFGNDKGIFSTTLSREIDKAADDDDVAAIVMRINSGGGSALASDIIWNSVVRAREKKPFIVSMAGAAASGGYYIAMPADSIFAAEGTMTGSIGVYGAKLFFGDLMEKGGVSQQKFTRGKHARIYSSTDRPWNDAEREIIQGSIDHMYKDFITKAADGRGMTVSDMDSVAQGRIWSGIDAVDQGLVDRNGGVWDAIKSAQKMAKIPVSVNPTIVLYPKQQTFFEMLAELESDAVNSLLPESIRKVFGVVEQTEQVTSFISGEPLLICPVEVTGENPVEY